MNKPLKDGRSPSVRRLDEIVRERAALFASRNRCRDDAPAEFAALGRAMVQLRNEHERISARLAFEALPNAELIRRDRVARAHLAKFSRGTPEAAACELVLEGAAREIARRAALSRAPSHEIEIPEVNKDTTAGKMFARVVSAHATGRSVDATLSQWRALRDWLGTDLACRIIEKIGMGSKDSRWRVRTYRLSLKVDPSRLSLSASKPARAGERRPAAARLAR